MLILTRKLGETIRIGEAVSVRVLEVRGSQVRIGIDAPSDVRIWRGEVYEQIQRERGDKNGTEHPGAPPDVTPGPRAKS